MLGIFHLFPNLFLSALTVLFYVLYRCLCNILYCICSTGVGSLFLLHVIFPSQGLNPGLPHCRWILYQLSHKGSQFGYTSHCISGMALIMRKCDGCFCRYTSTCLIFCDVLSSQGQFLYSFISCTIPNPRPYTYRGPMCTGGKEREDQASTTC